MREFYRSNGSRSFSPDRHRCTRLRGHGRSSSSAITVPGKREVSHGNNNVIELDGGNGRVWGRMAKRALALGCAAENSGIFITTEANVYSSVSSFCILLSSLHFH